MKRLSALLTACLAGVIAQAQSGPIQQGGIGPRIQALAAAVAKNEAGVVERFWTEIGRAHAPLVEPVTGDPNHVRVTFVWRAAPGTTAVRVFNMSMTRLAGTDVWHASMTMPKDHRIWYVFEPEVGSGAPKPVPDPLNPYRALPPVAEEWPASAAAEATPMVNSSIVVLPDAPVSPWVDPRPNAPRGRVQERAIPSRVHGGTKRTWIYTPPDTQPPAGLLICLWGANYLNEIPVPTILDNLIADGRMPRVAAIFIDETGDRFQNFQAAGTFSSFVARDVIPWAREQLHSPADPHRVIVAGYSASGLESSYIAFTHAELAGNVLSQSGAYWRAFEGTGATSAEWLTTRVTALPKVDVRFFVDVGGDEHQRPSDTVPSLLMSNQHLRDALATKGYAMKYVEVPGGEHEFLHWRSTFADGLLYLTSGWR